MRKNTIIMKFGGTSVGSPENIKQVIAIVLSSKHHVAGVAVSAFSGVTDQLILLANYAEKHNKKYLVLQKQLEQKHSDVVKKLITNSLHQKEVLFHLRKLFKELEKTLSGIFLLQELSPKTLDGIMSFGERLSAYIITESFNEKQIPSVFADARPLVKTNTDFSSAKVDFQKTNKNIQEFYKHTSDRLKIITGFIGSTDNNETTTLGRGGSDYTAAIFGAALNVNAIEIWTDVSGIMTADPKKVSGAFLLETMSYQEAMELSHFGAKVLHPPTIIPAMQKHIPIWIKNTFHPKTTGTIINQKTSHGTLIKGITSLSNISLVLLQGGGLIGDSEISMRLFTVLGQNKIPVILISQASSSYTLCLALYPKDAEKAKKIIEQEFLHEIRNTILNPVIITHNLSIIAVVGENMRKTPGIAAKLCNTLAENNINIVALAQGSSELNISFVIEKKHEIKALQAIHETFFEKITTEPVQIFLVGVGLIGSTLLEQIKETQQVLRKNKLISLQVIGIANSKQMIIHQQGIDLQNWKKELGKHGVQNNMQKFISEMKKNHKKNTIFVDCTASNDIPLYYKHILQAGISLVTPNKKGNSGSMKLYKNLRETAKKSGAKFLYETNVGAGLPIINTIKNFIATGDSITKIEGIFSGTLSYIFSNYIGDKKFSDIVYQAKEKGYTEPDPRDDLNGLDFGRKLLILAREIGLSLELKNIFIENLIPPKARNAHSVEDFFQLLKNEDMLFEKLKIKAENNKKALRYMGKIYFDKTPHLSCSLEMIDKTHPFYNLSGSDNILAIWSKRYTQTPLVIQGPGAGAEVTAAGVFADILSVANSV